MWFQIETANANLFLWLPTWRAPNQQGETSQVFFFFKSEDKCTGGSNRSGMECLAVRHISTSLPERLFTGESSNVGCLWAERPPPPFFSHRPSNQRRRQHQQQPSGAASARLHSETEQSPLHWHTTLSQVRCVWRQRSPSHKYTLTGACKVQAGFPLLHLRGSVLDQCDGSYRHHIMCLVLIRGGGDAAKAPRGAELSGW